jgi:hypothetical protein
LHVQALKALRWIDAGARRCNRYHRVWMGCQIYLREWVELEAYARELSRRRGPLRKMAWAALLCALAGQGRLGECLARIEEGLRIWPGASWLLDGRRLAIAAILGAGRQC